MRYFKKICCALLTAGLIACLIPDADAARIGGGRSFGGRSYMSVPAKNPAPSSSFRQQNAYSRNQNASAANTAASRPSRGGLFGGILGGLLAGTLLGSLFGGGFGGFGMIDILLFGALAFFLVRFLRRRASSQSAESVRRHEEPVQEQAVPSNTSMWEDLASGNGRQTGVPAGAAAAGYGGAASERSVPDSFDQEDFMKGARAVYVRMNESWDRRDLDDIAQFSTPAFMDEIRRQAEADPKPCKTEILLVNASLLETDFEEKPERAQVYFEVKLREDPSSQEVSTVREVWHFCRNDGETWKLDGIQQTM